jgi:hypothetical protein
MLSEHITLIGSEYFCDCCKANISKKPKDLRQHLSGKQHKSALKFLSTELKVLQFTRLIAKELISRPHLLTVPIQAKNLQTRSFHLLVCLLLKRE